MLCECMLMHCQSKMDMYIYIYICNWIVVVIASRVTDRSFAARLDVAFRIGYFATERQRRALGLLTHSDISLSPCFRIDGRRANVNPIRRRCGMDPWPRMLSTI